VDKEEKIRRPTTQAEEQEERLTYQLEVKKITAYEETIARLADRRLLAQQVHDTFQSNTFDVDYLQSETQAEIASRLRDTDATSFSATSHAAKSASQKSAVAKSGRMHQQLAAKAAAEKQAKARMKLSAKLDLPTEERNNSVGKGLAGDKRK
jgi:hypothetical protein